MPDAIDYLAHPDKHPPRPVCALYGNELFLRRRALVELRQAVLGKQDAEFSLTEFAGATAAWRDVRDELSTVAMFGGGQRMAVVDAADEFVTRYRSELEDYVARPCASSVLVLVVDTWPSNTRLAKAVADQGLAINCKSPTAAALAKWLTGWARKQHRIQLESDAVEVLLESVEPDLGLIDQELAKLAVSVSAGQPVTAELVQQVVGGWRSKTTWQMLDAAVDGNAREALVELDHLLAGGEVPVALLGQIGSTLRRFAAAARLVEQAEAQRRRTSLRDALQDAGFKPFVLARAEGQLKQLGRQRAGKLYRWLLDADLALKGTSSSPARARQVLEQLIARLSRAAQPAASGRR